MSVAKIERDIKLIENKLIELDATVADPIERNEQRKELEKKIKKLRRTKSQTEQLERERQEIESLKSEFTSNDEEAVVTKELEANNDNISEIEPTSVEQTPNISSKLNSETPTSDNSKQSKNTLIIGGIFGLLLLSGTLVAINENNQSQVASYAESQISKPVKAESQSSSLSSTPNQYRRQTIRNSISKQEAVELLSNWQNAKRQIFAYPFDFRLLERYQTDKKYQDNVGSVDWLRENNAYYKYGVQSIDSIEEFFVSSNRATIDVVITEQRTFYMNNRVVNDGNTAFDTRLVRYNLVEENGQWKIEDYNTVRKIKVR